MGHRASLVIVERDHVDVRYSHWAAIELGEHLVLGPEYALCYARAQRDVNADSDGGWLDDLWAAGGVTIDLPRRRLVWFDLPTCNDVARCRVVAALLRRTWPGWTVQWAYDRMGDIAAAAGGLVTITSDGRHSASLVSHAVHPARLGPDLEIEVRRWPGLAAGATAVLDLPVGELAYGLHLDVDRAELWYWKPGRRTAGCASRSPPTGRTGASSSWVTTSRGTWTCSTSSSLVPGSIRPARSRRSRRA